MQVKVFESTDMASGLKLVKKELGPDALILSTRTVRSGKLGILGKHVLEITAAVDTPWPPPQAAGTEKTISTTVPPQHRAYVENALLPSMPLEEEHGSTLTDRHYKIGKRPDRTPRPLNGIFTCKKIVKCARSSMSLKV